MRLRTGYRAPQYNVNAMVTQASQRSRASAAKLSAMGSVLTGINNLRKVQDAYTNEEEVQEFQKQTALAERKFIELYGSKASFTAKEVSRYLDDSVIATEGIKLTESYVTDDGETAERPRMSIPAHEVYTLMYGSFMKKNTEVSGSKITNSRIRSSAMSRQTIMNQSKIVRSATNAAVQQRKLLRNSVKVDVDQLQDAGLYENARNRLKSSTVITKAEQKVELTNVDKREETDRYDNLVTTGNIGKLQSAHDLLSLDFEEYQKEGGNLSKPEKRTQFQMVDRKISQLTTQQRTQNNARLSVVRQEVREAITDLEQGLPPDTNYLKDRRSILYASGTPMDNYLLQKLETATHFGIDYAHINMRGYAEGDAIIDQVLANNVGAVPNIAKLESRLRKANEQKQQALVHDPVAHGRKFYDIPVFDPSDMATSLIAAKRGAKQMESAYGISGAYLSRSDWYNIKQAYDSADLDGKVELMGTITTGMGSEASAFFESGMDKAAGPMAVVGVIASDNPEGAKVVVQGQEMMKNTAIKIPKDFDSAARNALTTAFGDADVSAQRMSAVKAAYAYLAFDENGLEAITGIEDPDILKAALKTTTRGIIEFNGTRIEAPGIAVNEKQFKKTIRSISSKHWDREGGFVGYPSKNVKEGLDKGTLTFRRAGAGEYFIMDQDGRPLQSKLTGAEYRFNYNADIYDVNQASASKKDRDYRAGLIDPDRLAKKRQARMEKATPLLGVWGMGGS